MGIRWQSSNEVFVPELDAEHRTLFRMVEELRRMMKSDGAQAGVAGSMRALLSEAEAHFGREEQLMGDSRFWGASWHQGQHATARKHLRNALRAHQKGDAAKADRELKSLGSWLDDHTSIADRILGAFLRNHARTNTAQR